MTGMRPHRHLARGFTLFEVLLSLALIMALGSVMFGFVFNLLESRQRVVEVTAQHRAVAILFDRLEADLASTIVTGGAGAGVQGDATSLSVLSRGYALQPLAEQDVDGAFGDLQKTTIAFDEAARRLRIQRDQADSAETPSVDVGSSSNVRDSAPSLDAGAPKPDELAEPIDAPVWRVRFRYHDGTGWRDTYNSESQGQLPVAVEIAVWLRPWPGESWEEEEESAATNELERLTFDDEPVFDEEAWASRPDRDFEIEPRPDRMRVIAVPDARPREIGTGDAERDSFGAEEKGEA